MDAKSKTKKETKLLSTISHELRTPLNSIIGFAELLKDQVYGEINEKQAQYLNNILSSSRNLLFLLNDLIDLINLKWEDADLEFSEFSIIQAIKEARMLVEPLASHKNILIVVRNDEQLPTIKADEVKFKKILHHLLSNAVKFTPSGGKVEIVTRYLKAPPAHFTSLPTQPCAEVSVIDNGIGIKKEDQENIFSEFYQNDSTLSREFEGTGLGLSLARDMVNLHHGKIWVASKEGEGSKFSFIIPLTKIGGLRDKIMAGEKILLVEDTLLNRELAKDVLELAGYQVFEAVNGKEAISYARQYNPDLILMDIELPDMDGLEVTRLLKEDPLTRDIPVVALTAHSQPGDQKNILEACCVGHILKPIDTKRFPQMVAEFLK
ncbi:MAG: response regulator [Thermodesulfobacteriota bacterium]|nr:response regulator [Thermodesulfobacteriota bacterium]